MRTGNLLRPCKVGRGSRKGAVRYGTLVLPIILSLKGLCLDPYLGSPYWRPKGDPTEGSLLAVTQLLHVCVCVCVIERERESIVYVYIYSYTYIFICIHMY
jgi:hypothetical protein